MRGPALATSLLLAGTRLTHAEPASYDISREQVRDLHHGQRLSFTEIGQRTGYSRSAINDLARTYGIPAGIYREG